MATTLEKFYKEQPILIEELTMSLEDILSLHLRRIHMFHKALWMRQWKQGKYIILLFWLTSLYQLPYKYYQEAQMQLKLSK